jgi:hypothetical protein
VLREDELWAVTRAGELLLTQPETEGTRQAEAQAHAQTEAARHQVVEEVARLRAALESLTRGDDEAPTG